MSDMATERPLWMDAVEARVTRFEDREAWLKGRGDGIGGSEVAIVMGKSTFGSPYSLWARKTGLEDDTEDNDILEFGRLVEPLIADRYAAKTGRQLIDLGPFAIRRHPTVPYLFCTHDRLIAPVDGHDGPGVLSIKSVNPYIDEGEWADAEAPVKYEIQLQAELAASGLSWGSFAFLRWGRPVQWFDRKRNDNFIAAMEDACAEFWERVLTGRPPPVDGSEHTSRALARLFPEADPSKIVTLPVEAAGWSDELEAVGKELKRLEARKAELRNQLKQAIGDAIVGVVPNGPRWSCKSVSRAGFWTDPATYRDLRRMPEKKASK